MTAYEEAEAKHKLESQCIRKYIQLGIERRDIDVSNGTCSIRTNQKLTLVINQKLSLPIYLIFENIIKTFPQSQIKDLFDNADEKVNREFHIFCAAGGHRYRRAD